MSGKHRRPEPDLLPEADVAGQMVAGPVIEASAPALPGPELSAPALPGPELSASALPGPELSASALSGPTVVARTSRQAQRRARRQSQRRHVTLIAGAMAAVLVVAAGGWWLLGRDGNSSNPSDSAQHKQRTLLIQVAGPDGTAKGSALLGVRTDEKRAAAVLVPSRLIVDAPGSGSVAFGETLGLPDHQAPAKALTDLIGVTVDGSWVLTPAGLSALVDKVGGVPAEVDVDVVTKDAAGADQVVVRAGSQHLGGPAAVAYATYAVAEEPEQARLARFNDVLDGVLRGLPDQTREIEGTVTSLKAGSSTTIGVTLLGQILKAAHDVAKDGDMLSDVLPVNTIATGSGEESYGVNAQQAAALMQARFAPSLVADTAGGAVRVLVQNGVGTPGLVDKARTKLVKAGFRFVNGGNASAFGEKTSTVLIPDSAPASVDRGAAVAAALGLPASAVGVSGQGQTVAEVIVVLGRDFKP
jgi:anionic cell wall polymer biosynthesis LytR-Cps2A-Psr (LCP) family protein